MRSNHTIPVLNRKEPFLLAFGDLVLMAFSLWAGIVLRYGELPDQGLIQAHLLPFAIVFMMSLVVFYASGLYGRAINVARTSIPGTVIRAQIANGLLAVALLYFFPSFTVTPRVNLFIYLILATVFIILWRLNAQPLFSLRKKSPAVVIGAGAEALELVAEMSRNPRLGLYCRERIDPSAPVAEIMTALERGNGGFQYIIADLDDPFLEPVLPELYGRFFAKARIIDLHELYEEVYDMIPLSRMDHAWIMSAISSLNPVAYDVAKRVFDVLLGIVVAVVACIAYPFVAIAVKLEDGGPVFIAQERVGKDGKVIRIYKFRSMQRNETDKWVAESGASDNKVTRVGRFLRASRIDELPQALAILNGDMSLIGPRPDAAGLAARLEKEIPYYQVRTVIAPGLTGWAQVSQDKPPQSVEETKLRLSYDLYYITHRSLGLDLAIALRTLRTLLSRLGA